MQTEYIIVKSVFCDDYDSHYNTGIYGTMTDWQTTDDINEIYKKVELINKYRYAVINDHWDRLVVITKVDDFGFDALYKKALEEETKIEQKRKKEKEQREAAKLKREQKTLAQKKIGQNAN